MTKTPPIPQHNRQTTFLSAFGLLRQALPITTFYLAEFLISLTNLAVVSVLGTTELAAAGLAKSLLFAIMVVAFAVVSLVTIFVAERRDPSYCGTALLAASGIAVPFSLLAILVGQFGTSLLWLGQYDADFLIAFDSYAGTLAFAIAPALLFAIIKNILNALQRMQSLIWLSGGMVLGNLLLSLVLVHGLPKWAGVNLEGLLNWEGMGLQGAALATVIIHSLAGLALLVSVMYHKLVQFSDVTFSAICDLTRAILKLGWAAGVHQMVESLLFFMVLYLLGLHALEWLAAATVVIAVMEINYMISLAQGEVLGAWIAAARKKGGGNLTYLLNLGIGLSGVCAASVILIIMLFAETIASLFLFAHPPSSKTSLMVELLRWSAPFFIFDTWQVIFSYALRGMRQTFIPMLISFGSYGLVGIAGGIFLASVLMQGALGIWVGFCAGLICAALILARMAYQQATPFPQNGR